jgi:hypothetical protein
MLSEQFIQTKKSESFPVNQCYFSAFLNLIYPIIRDFHEKKNINSKLLKANDKIYSLLYCIHLKKYAHQTNELMTRLIDLLKKTPKFKNLDLSVGTMNDANSLFNTMMIYLIEKYSESVININTLDERHFNVANFTKSSTKSNTMLYYTSPISKIEIEKRLSKCFVKYGTNVKNRKYIIMYCPSNPSSFPFKLSVSGINYRVARYTSSSGNHIVAIDLNKGTSILNNDNVKTKLGSYNEETKKTIEAYGIRGKIRTVILEKI